MPRRTIENYDCPYHIILTNVKTKPQRLPWLDLPAHCQTPEQNLGCIVSGSTGRAKAEQQDVGTAAVPSFLAGHEY